MQAIAMIWNEFHKGKVRPESLGAMYARVQTAIYPASNLVHTSSVRT
ncbi:hypothetical protein SAMN05444390_11033 [Marinobacterium lutimaris]|uniref:Uncharacterized protein n=1 Tax=Marinobacterium lutimaris TaxID=568106 RepID=A0A1H6DW58_9GAMM|nr:hypothetical protein SAMN05444390_11033 [Marinobacterium lutimaris]